MKVIIIGDGRHSQVIQEMISALPEYKIVAVLDDKYEEPFYAKGITYAEISFIYMLLTANTKVVVAIGSNESRKNIVENLPLIAEQYLTVIHPSAVISPSASIGYGTVVMPNAAVNARSRIGQHSIINTGSIIEHDNLVENYTHISPNATLAGQVSIGEGSHICSSATIIPGKNIGNWSIVGAGSTVLNDIPSYSKAVGSPTRIIEKSFISKVQNK